MHRLFPARFYHADPVGDSGNAPLVGGDRSGEVFGTQFELSGLGYDEVSVDVDRLLDDQIG